MRTEICCIFMTFAFGSIVAQSNNECTTPKNEAGFCIDVLECRALRSTILEYRKKVESYNLIKASFCGYEGRKTKVCCPSDVAAPSDSPEPELTQPAPANSTVPSSLLPSTATCGRVEVNHDRIIGGNPAVLGAWPWIAALGYELMDTRKSYDYQWACGGSLITEKHVLTAAHCVVNLQGRKLSVVRLGELNLNSSVQDGATPIDLQIEKIMPHESYGNFMNDIALIKLKNSVSFTRFIKPICLLDVSAMNKVNYLKSMPYVAGWGSTNPFPKDDFRYPPNTALMEVQIPIMNTTECSKIYNRYDTNVIDNRVICAGYRKGGKDSCRGDSGGPLMWPINKQYFLMGIVSYGTEICGQPNLPGVYTRVPTFIDWIEDKLQE